MRIIILMIILMMNAITSEAASERQLQAEIEEFKKFQAKVSYRCLKGPNVEIYFIIVQGKKLGCKELLIIADEKREAMAVKVAALKASCNLSSSTEDIDNLAKASVDIAKKIPVCKVSKDAKSCTSQYLCAGMGAIAPNLSTVLAVVGVEKKSDSMRQCGSSGMGCIENLARGVFDSVWSLVSLVWEYALKKPFIKAGELMGLISESEAKTSERAMAAQTVSPSFLSRFKADPAKVISDFFKDIFESIKTAAMDHYGCQKWSGVPYFSTCLAPLMSWDCATCQQKAQVYCGVGGYALGEIVTSYLTMGSLTLAKASITSAAKLTGAPARAVGKYMSKTFPKVSESAIEVASKVGSLTADGLSAAQKAAIASYEALEATSLSRAIQAGAKTYHKSVLGLITTKPIGLYLEAMKEAGELGVKHADKIIGRNDVASSGAKVARVSHEAEEGRKIANTAMEGDIPAGQTLYVKFTENSQARIMPNRRVNVQRIDSDIVSQSKTKKTTTSTSTVKKEVNSESLFGRFSKDPEFEEFFTKYPQHGDEFADFLGQVEKQRPELTKAQIRKLIQDELRTCK